MNELQDIIGSMVFGGIILVMVIGFNGNISESAAMQTFHSTTQSNTTTFTNILEYDLRKLGYRVTNTDKITVADTSKISFKGDFDGNGLLDSVTYYLGTTVPSGAVNPRVRTMYRKLNTEGFKAMNLGITKFRLWYYNGSGAVTDTLAHIRSIKVAMSFESSEPYNSAYSGAYWERVIKPKNLR